ncbi:MAG: hypothetical protein J6Y92_05825, partial [Lentisphaeria bacterium]|nr:hypothetical protein [Lentisphaeria bacterium]
GGQRPAGQGQGQGGQRQRRQGQGQGGQGGFGGGMGGFGGGMGGGGGASVDTVSQIQEKFPEEYKAAQQLRQTDPAGYRAKLRELQQKLTANN